MAQRGTRTQGTRGRKAPTPKRRDALPKAGKPHPARPRAGKAQPARNADVQSLAATAAARARRLDEWGSVLTGLGRQERDKRLSFEFEGEDVSLEELEDLYRGDDLASRIVENPVDAMLRQGWDLVVEGDSGSLAEDVAALLDELGAETALHEALCAAGYAGGGLILLGADDGLRDAPDKPLRLEAVKKGGLQWLTVFTPREVMPVLEYDNPNARDFGQPSAYQVRQEVDADAFGARLAAPRRMHASRFIRFDGVRIPRRHMVDNGGWHDSALRRVVKVIRDYQTSWGTAAVLMQEFAQAILRLKGLAELIAADEDGKVLRRAELLTLARSIANTLLLDEGEDFRREVVPLGGLPEMLEQMALRVAGAARQPATLLFGRAPAGLNATGESDVRGWYDYVKAQQVKQLRPALNRLVQLSFRHLGVREPSNWTVRFRPLWQLTEGEAADVRLKQAQVDKVYLDSGALTPEEVALSRFGGDDYSSDTRIDVASRQSLFEDSGGEAPEEEEEAEEAFEEAPPAAQAEAPPPAA